MEKEYIYILSNDKHQGYLKIGKTKDAPEIRAKDLSRQTGVIGKFVVEWFIVVPNCDLAEKMAHYKLKQYREENGKESFLLELKEAKRILEKIFVDFFELEKPEIYNLEKENLKRQLTNALKLAAEGGFF